MASTLPEFYVVDESANLINNNAKTQKDILYVERDTKAAKLGTGDRYCDIEYWTPSIHVDIDSDVVKSIDELIRSVLAEIQFEPPIDKKSAFNLDFGTTENTIAKGRHTHSIGDITDYVTPVLQQVADPITIDSEPSNSTNPISSKWALGFVSYVTKSLKDIVNQLHKPVEITGDGLYLKDQILSIRLGRTEKTVCPGLHVHDEYANRAHTHNISADQLPLVSTTSRGAIQPTGEPSGRTLHDDGSWKYGNSMSIVTPNPYWVAPCGAYVVLASVFSMNKDTSAVVNINGEKVCDLKVSVPRYYNVYDDQKYISREIKKGDVIYVSGPSVQLGVVLYQ